MKIEIKSTKYFITADPYQFVLNEYFTGERKKTKESFIGERVVGFYPNLKQIYNKICQEITCEEEIKSFEKLLDRYEEIGDTFSQAIKSFKELR